MNEEKLKIYEEFYEKVKRIIRDSGKSFIESHDIDEAIIQVGNKLARLKNE